MQELRKETLPLRLVCAICGSTDLEDSQMGPSGTIVTAMYNTARGVVSGYEDVAPQIFCVIQLDDGPFIEAEVTNVSSEFVKQQILEQNGWAFRDALVGKRVRMILRRLRKLDNGNLTYGYKFEVENPP